MGVEVHWFDANQTLLYYRVQDGCTWDEAHTTLQTGRSMARQVGHEINVIVDLLALKGEPPDILYRVQKLLEDRPANIAHVVWVSRWTFIHHLAATFARAFVPLVENHHLARSLEEAQQILSNRNHPVPG